jgi:hypothetical protein
VAGAFTDKDTVALWFEGRKSLRVPYPLHKGSAADFPARSLRRYPQSPPNFRGNQSFVPLSLVPATRGGYKPFGS